MATYGRGNMWVWLPRVVPTGPLAIPSLCIAPQVRGVAQNCPCPSQTIAWSATFFSSSFSSSFQPAHAHIRPLYGHMTNTKGSHDTLSFSVTSYDQAIPHLQVLPCTNSVVVTTGTCAGHMTTHARVCVCVCVNWMEYLIFLKLGRKCL